MRPVGRRAEERHMQPLSKKLVLALGAVIDIAYNAGLEPVQSKEITSRQGIPQRYLEQVMQELVRAGVLKGLRGPRGGYRLARERRRITLGDIARVVDGVERSEDTTEALAVSELGIKVLGPLCQELSDDLMERLDAINVEDLCRRARAEGVKTVHADRLNFTI
jgi:Rrf2 family protein